MLDAAFAGELQRAFGEKSEFGDIERSSTRLKFAASFPGAIDGSNSSPT